jgi:hypothetical protein
LKLDFTSFSFSIFAIYGLPQVVPFAPDFDEDIFLVSLLLRVSAHCFKAAF